MEKWKNTQDPVVMVQHEDLIELLDIGGDVEMGKQNALGIAR